MYAQLILIKDNKEVDNLIIANLIKKFIIIGILSIKSVFLISKPLFNNGLKPGKFDFSLLMFNFVDINRIISNNI
jgi:hypothetical protein